MWKEEKLIIFSRFFKKALLGAVVVDKTATQSFEQVSSSDCILPCKFVGIYSALWRNGFGGTPDYL